LILKQARPWVEKYPHIEAPVDRVAVEAHFFQIVQKIKGIEHMTPHCLGYDGDNFVLAIEDLGEGADFTYLYQKDQALNDTEIDALMHFINTLHNWDTSDIVDHFPANIGMRELNHEHIFVYPYREDHGFNLDDIQPGLAEVSRIYRRDRELNDLICALGQIYLSHGETLLQGDYYPGSWLKVPDGVRIIDPEFGFIGKAEFEMGVMIAHLYLSQQNTETLTKVWRKYHQPSGFDMEMLAGFAGTEILRRLIGLAQLPLDMDLSQKEALLALASHWVKSGKIAELD
jgi:5-methylthioribose kinase